MTRTLLWTEADVIAHARQHGKPIPRGLAPLAGPTTTLRLDLPPPPTTNNAYVNLKSGGRVSTAEAKKFKEFVFRETQVQARLQGFEYQTGRRVRVTMRFVFANVQRDIANGEKLAVDSISSALGFNDRFVDEIHLYRDKGEKGQNSCQVVLELI